MVWLYELAIWICPILPQLGRLGEPKTGKGCTDEELPGACNTRIGISAY
jgi:hypothetical protein